VKSVLGLAIALLALAGCQSSERDTVVLYTSQDQFYAEPILREFTRETGIEVRAVFDTESAKTAGLANRLRHEKSNPHCDVFWNNEEMHTRLLVHEGVIQSNAVRTAGYRTRRLVVNTNLLPLAQAPAGLLALTNASWRGKIVLAYPLYGTTSSHFLALRQLWGEEVWRRWCEGLVANGAKVVDGNSVVVKLVGAGEAWIGLTDSDDIAAGQRAGLPVEQAPLNGELLAIPNTISRIATARTTEADRLIEFLTRPETIDRLVAIGALEGRDFSASRGATLSIRWENISAEMAAVLTALREIFLRS
jgi:iron(III) transport system substrate-binding protein